MDIQLLLRGLTRMLAGFIAIALLMFIPAGTLAYAGGWLLLGLLFGPMLAAGIWMAYKAPGLLRKRLNAREPEADQRRVVLFSGLIFTAAFAVAGLNYRFDWPKLPEWLIWLGAALFLAGYALYGEVLRENEYLSRTVEVQPGQRVIDTGLYGLVRHPMYSSTLLMFLCMPLILGSPFSAAVMLGYVPVIVCRIRGEERVLEAGLPGYRDYESRVRWRLLPGIW